MPFPNAVSRFMKWPWSRTLILVTALVGLVTFNLIPDREDRPRGRMPDGGASGIPISQQPTETPTETPRTLARDPSAISPSVPSQTVRDQTNRREANPPAELPIWERPPRTTIQPFPEEARFDPPLPPFKVPPEMIGEPSRPVAVDALPSQDDSPRSDGAVPASTP
jgi:hypothetical protein